MFECKYVFQPIEFSFEKPNTLSILNRNFFISSDDYNYHWELRDEDSVLQSGQVTFEACAPGQSASVVLPIKSFKMEPGAEYWVRVSATEKSDKVYAEAGFEVAWDQFAYNTPEKVETKANIKGSVTLAQNDNTISVSGKGFDVKIVDGYISQYTQNGVELISSPLKPNFWRADTDNDWRGWKTWNVMGFWKDADKVMQSEVIDVVESAGKVAITTKVSITDKAQLTLNYTITADGAIEVDYALTKESDLPELLRVGMQCEVNNQLERVTYYGLGEWENYCDRARSAMMGTYRSTVEEMMFDYVVPQENGNRCGVRWFAMQGKNRGIQIIGQEPLSVSVWNATQEAIYNAKHINELEALENSFTLNIDKEQAGVGGTDSWSIKARPMEQHRLLEDAYNYSFKIVPVTDKSKLKRASF
ncbi:MAG: beta-galactosidase domain 4-containing protein [Rikenellaceae bacterium]